MYLRPGFVQSGPLPRSRQISQPAKTSLSTSLSPCFLPLGHPTPKQGKGYEKNCIKVAISQGRFKGCLFKGRLTFLLSHPFSWPWHQQTAFWDLPLPLLSCCARNSSAATRQAQSQRKRRGAMANATSISYPMQPFLTRCTWSCWCCSHGCVVLCLLYAWFSCIPVDRIAPPSCWHCL